MFEAQVVSTLRRAGCVFAEDEAALLIAAAATPRELESLVAERVSGVPLEHLLGWVQFAGHRIAVDRGVFVPRRRTELLVLEALAGAPHAPVVVDLCCGCGAIATALLAAEPAEVHAADLDPVAVACAARNLGGRGTVYVGSLFDPLPATLRGRVDVLTCNAPYVPTGAIATMPPEARDHEPGRALDGGTDGLDLLRRVIAEAVQWLAPQGCLLVEASAGQALHLAGAAGRAGLTAQIVHDDGLDATAVVMTPRRRVATTTGHDAGTA